MYDARKIEEEVLDFWKKNKIYQKSKDKNKGKKPFYFLQGPPYTSGRLHCGQAWNHALKDSILRYKRMKGLHVWDRAGYDMHGLPTESKVQKKLGLKTKEDIVKFGLNKFAKECMKFSVEHAKLMDKDLSGMGIWMDYENAYHPIDEEWIESVWWLVKRAEEKNRLYEGEKTMSWCSECATALAKHECEYAEIEDNSIFVKFKVEGKDNEYLIIWTTTPWTITFNLGIMANPNFTYVKAKVDNETWIVAKDLADEVIKGKIDRDYTIIEEITGKDLIGTKYLHPWENEISDLKKVRNSHPNAFTVVSSNKFVTLDTGTGLVHMAPGCGPEDYEVGLQNKIPPFNTINQEGVFPENYGEISGWTAKKDDQKFIKKLSEDGVLLKTEKVKHDYAHCERCKSPVIFRTTKQWFFKVSDLKDKMLEYNKKIHWIPDSINNAFVSWLENLRDNSITKQRFWGTPIPVWKCESCGDYTVVSSKEELSKLAGKIPENLHIPWIDEITIDCGCGGTKKRLPDVLDVWIDAGVASWACLYYPKRKDLIDSLFPPDFILEGSDQIRGWYNLLMVCSVLGLDKIPFKNNYTHGMLTDVEGVKMSKSLGNVLSPYEIIEKHGTDAMRLYFTQTNAGENINFSWPEVEMKQRNLNVLWNVHNYLIEYHKSLEKSEDLQTSDRGLEEKYILSKLNRTMKQVTELYEFYRLDEVPGLLEELFLDLSREYIQSVRDKINKDPELVLNTIFHVLFETLKMLSTVSPFITEKIYQNLEEEFGLKVESIHLFDWPEASESLIDTKLENNFLIAKQIIQAGLSSREKSGFGVRWPLEKITVVSGNKDVRESISSLEGFILSKLNVKKIDFKEKSGSFNVELSPNKTSLGRDFKRDSPKIIIKMSEKVMKDIVEGKPTFIDKFNLNKEHVLVKQMVPDNLNVSEFKLGHVILDIELTKDLETEGYVRELARRLQDLRKEIKLKKVDKINISIKTDLDISSWEKFLKERVGINNLIFGEKDYSEFREFKIKDHKFGIHFEILTTKE